MITAFILLNMDIKKIWNEHRGLVIVGVAAIVFAGVCVYNKKTVTVASNTTPPPPTPPALTQTF